MGYCDLVEGEEVFDDELLINEDDSTSCWVEGCEQVIFGKMDGKLYELFMQLFEG